MDLLIAPPPELPDLPSDILWGADEIAEFLFLNRKQRRKIYHLVETSRLPVFRIGSKICARRSVLIKWIEDQEKRSPGPK